MVLKFQLGKGQKIRQKILKMNTINLLFMIKEWNELMKILGLNYSR